MKTLNDSKRYHRLGAYTNDYHVMYRKQQYSKHMRDTFKKNPEQWRRMMRNKLNRPKR